QLEGRVRGAAGAGLPVAHGAQADAQEPGGLLAGHATENPGIPELLGGDVDAAGSLPPLAFAGRRAACLPMHYAKCAQGCRCRSLLRLLRYLHAFRTRSPHRCRSRYPTLKSVRYALSRAARSRLHLALLPITAATARDLDLVVLLPRPAPRGTDADELRDSRSACGLPETLSGVAS